MILASRRAEKDATKQKVLSFQIVGQKRKMVVKIEFTPLSLALQTAKFVPLKMVLKMFAVWRVREAERLTYLSLIISVRIIQSYHLGRCRTSI